MLERTRQLSALRRDARGLSALEYALLFILLVVAGLVIWNKLGQSLGTQVDSGTDELSAALAGAQLAAPGQAPSHAPDFARDTPAQRKYAQPSSPPLGAAAPNPRGADANARTGNEASSAPADATTAARDQPARAPAQTETAPPRAAGPTSWWQDAKDYVRESAPAQFIAGIAAGAIDSTTVVTGFVPNPEDSSVYFEVGRVSGEFGAGVAQIYYGSQTMVFGATLGAGGVLAAPETLGASLTVAAAGAVVTTTGIAIAGNGTYHAGRALDRAWNMMTGADDAAPGSAAHSRDPRPAASSPAAAPGSSTARLTPDEAFKEIDRMRGKVDGMEPLGDRIPKPGDGAGTVALVESQTGARTYAGLNSSLISDESKRLARDAFTQMKARGMLKDAKQFGQGSSQVLLHAEAHALLRAANRGQLGGKVRLYVDRLSCGNCRAYLPDVMKHLGIEQLEIITKSGQRFQLP